MSSSDPTRTSQQRLAFELLSLLRSAPVGGYPILSEKFTISDTIAQGRQKRGNRRFRAPVLRVLIGSDNYETIDWSLGGLMVSSYRGGLKVNARVKIIVSDGSASGRHYAAECRVTRHDTQGRTLGLRFVALSKGAFEWFSGLQLMQIQKSRKRSTGGDVKQPAKLIESERYLSGSGRP